MIQIHNILNPQGYFARHFQLLSDAKTQQDAYEQVEQEYRDKAKELGLKQTKMFSSYESFRNGKSLYFKNPANR